MKIRISRHKATAGSVYSAPSMYSNEQTERSDEQIAADDKAEKERQEKEKKEKIEEAKKKAEEKEEKEKSGGGGDSGGDDEEGADDSDDEESDDEDSDDEEDDEEEDDSDDEEDDEESEDDEEATASANKEPVPAHIMPNSAAQPAPKLPFPEVNAYTLEDPVIGAIIPEKEQEQKEGVENPTGTENISKKTQEAIEQQPEPKRESTNNVEMATASSVPYPDCVSFKI